MVSINCKCSAWLKISSLFAMHLLLQHFRPFTCLPCAFWIWAEIHYNYCMDRSVRFLLNDRKLRRLLCHRQWCPVLWFVCGAIVNWLIICNLKLNHCRLNVPGSNCGNCAWTIAVCSMWTLNRWTHWANWKCCRWVLTKFRYVSFVTFYRLLPTQLNRFDNFSFFSIDRNCLQISSPNFLP